MMPTRSPGLRPRSCSSPATRALASSSARYVIAALSTRTATRPAQARVVSVRFLARFVTLLLSGRGPRRSSVPGIKPVPKRWYGGTTVVPWPEETAHPRVASTLSPGSPRPSVMDHTAKGADMETIRRCSRGAEHRGVRCPDRDPAGQPEQVRGRPRQRPDPPGPDAVHRDPVPGRLRLRAGHAGRRRRSARRAGAGAGTHVSRLPDPQPPDRHVPDDRRERRRRQDPVRARRRPAPGTPARPPPPTRIRPAGDRALLLDLQGTGTGQERRGRVLGRPRRRRSRGGSVPAPPAGDPAARSQADTRGGGSARPGQRRRPGQRCPPRHQVLT